MSFIIYFCYLFLPNRFLFFSITVHRLRNWWTPKLNENLCCVYGNLFRWCLIIFYCINESLNAESTILPEVNISKGNITFPYLIYQYNSIKVYSIEKPKYERCGLNMINWFIKKELIYWLWIIIFLFVYTIKACLMWTHNFTIGLWIPKKKNKKNISWRLFLSPDIVQ